MGEAHVDLENAPYGGARYPISSFIDGRLFVRFQLVVGGDAIVSEVETLQGKDWLGFCGIVPPLFKMISAEQQMAEKLHAYTLPRHDRQNTRVKDLIDMALLSHMQKLDLKLLRQALRQVFNVRDTHTLPPKLERPPLEWERPYLELATECNLSKSLPESFEEVARLYEKMVSLEA